MRPVIGVGMPLPAPAPACAQSPKPSYLSNWEPSFGWQSIETKNQR